MLNWWYTDGWSARLRKSKQSIGGMTEFFSIGQLAKTLFSPFRQISAGKVNGPVGVQLRAFVDQLISRAIGGVVRFFVILFGLIAIVATALVQFIVVLFWLLMPLVFVGGFIMAVIGWVPSWK